MPSPPFTVGIYLSHDDQFDSADERIAEYSTVNVPLGTTTHRPGSVALRQDIAPGTYRVFVWIDNKEAVTETDEGNNLFLSPQPFTVLPPIDADLSIRTENQNRPMLSAGHINFQDAHSTDISICKEGTLFSSSYEVVNTGTVPSMPCTIGYFLSIDSDITTANRSVGTHSLPAIGPGESITIGEGGLTYVGHFQLPQSVDRQYFGIIIDTAGAFFEAGDQEANNISLPITINVIPGASEATRVRRAQLELTTGSGAHYGTKNPVFARVAGRRLFLNYGGNNFKRGPTFAVRQFGIAHSLLLPSSFSRSPHFSQPPQESCPRPAALAPLEVVRVMLQSTRLSSLRSSPTRTRSLRNPFPASSTHLAFARSRFGWIVLHSDRSLSFPRFRPASTLGGCDSLARLRAHGRPLSASPTGSPTSLAY